MTNRYLLGAGLVLAVAFGGAQAQAQFMMMPTGPGTFYFGGEGGWTDLENQRTTIGPIKVTNKYSDGFNVGARAGWEWGPWRLEEEYSYHYNHLNSLSTPFGTFGNSVFTGDRTAHAIMTNLLYDFTFGWPVTPHIGFGVGAVDIVDSVKLKPTTVATPLFNGGRPFIVGGSLLHDNDWQFGYQGIVGLRYNINQYVSLEGDYRYLATTDPTFTNRGSLTATTPGGAVLATGSPIGKYKSEYSTHNFVASLTVRFGPPPPPPALAPPAPPAALPPPPRNVYLVFFDWDKYNITPEGMRIIEQAANQYKAGGRVQLQVTGYTDLSGSAGYNQRLSERRANAVANALVRLGVPRNDMAVSGRGMNDPRVPTAPGVREPQNRRVEIVFP
jgi:OOP family OmpA-OmpF porin